MSQRAPEAPPELQLFADESFFSHGAAARADTFRRLRDDWPVSFMDEPEIPLLGQGPGFWSVTRHEHVMYVSRHPDLFCSGQGTTVIDMPIELSEFMGSMLNMDDPRHTRLRKIINRAFTPKRVAAIDRDVRVKARSILAAVAERGECDVVEELAAPLPLQIICEMMGIPEDSWHRVFELTNVILGAGDPELTPDMATLMAAVMELAQMAQQVGEARLAEPTDDLVSAIMHAEVDGERLTTMEMASFFILLSTAGNETTRNAISHGLVQLTRNPDQRAVWQADPEGVTPTAVEEIVRYATPVISFRRTATRDVTLGDVQIAEGDKVMLWYESANRDERVFDDPDRFDVTRSPNEHVGFGAGGPHFCLGANLARREIGVMFTELLHWMPDIHTTTEPDHLQSGFIHGIKRLRCEFTPTTIDTLED